jgi:hypothetical protein
VLLDVGRAEVGETLRGADGLEESPRSDSTPRTTEIRLFGGLFD